MPLLGDPAEGIKRGVRGMNLTKGRKREDQRLNIWIGRRINKQSHVRETGFIKHGGGRK